MRHSEVSSHSCHTEHSEKSSSWYIERSEISTPCHTEPLGEVSNESSQNFQRDSSLFAKVQNEQDSVILSESEVSQLCHIERSEISNNRDTSLSTKVQYDSNICHYLRETKRPKKLSLIEIFRLFHKLNITKTKILHCSQYDRRLIHSFRIYTKRTAAHTKDVYRISRTKAAILHKATLKYRFYKSRA